MEMNRILKRKLADQEQPNPLEKCYKDLSIEDLTFRNQEDMAYKAIKKSLNNTNIPEENPKRKLVNSLFKKLWNVNAK